MINVILNILWYTFLAVWAIYTIRLFIKTYPLKNGNR